jgi:hypothetical protein
MSKLLKFEPWNSKRLYLGLRCVSREAIHAVGDPNNDAYEGLMEVLPLNAAQEGDESTGLRIIVLTNVFDPDELAGRYNCQSLVILAV